MATITTGDGGHAAYMAALNYTSANYYISDVFRSDYIGLSYSNGVQLSYSGYFSINNNGSLGSTGTLMSMSVSQNGQSLLSISDFVALYYNGNFNNVYNILVGADRFYLGDGADIMYGEGGADTMYGNGGDDYLTGDGAADVLYGGMGRDSLSGGYDADSLFGGQDADRIWGGDGADLIQSGKANDSIYGEGGADTIRSGLGADYIIPGFGADLIYIGAGADTIIGFSYSTGDRINAPPGYTASVNGTDATITLASGENVKVTLSGSVGSDWIFS